MHEKTFFRECGDIHAESNSKYYTFHGDLLTETVTLMLYETSAEWNGAVSVDKQKPMAEI